MIEPALSNRRCQIGGRAGEVLVIAVAIAGGQAPCLMVEVVGPHGVEAPSAVLGRPDYRRQIAFVFRDQQDRAVRQRGANASGELGDEMTR